MGVRPTRAISVSGGAGASNLGRRGIGPPYEQENDRSIRRCEVFQPLRDAGRDSRSGPRHAGTDTAAAAAVMGAGLAVLAHELFISPSKSDAQLRIVPCSQMTIQTKGHRESKMGYPRNQCALDHSPCG